VVLALLAAACSGGTPPTGPLGQTAADEAWGWSRTVEVGQRFTDGQALVFVADPTLEITITSVEPLTEGDGLRHLGTSILGPDRATGIVQYVDSWPPPASEFGVAPHDVIGARLTGADDVDSDLPNGVGWELLVGFAVTGAGRSTVQGYRVVYEHEGRRYSTVLGTTVAICAQERPPQRTDDCEPEYEIHLDHAPTPPTWER
jgi:hypothetical protein